ncbi:hypothetical protein N9I82_02375 [Alphaproteobacteria bacterium]|nr:hypothetical protein [Alphaproteobacteria bacterium]
MRHDDALPKKKVRPSKGAQEIAFMALQNVIIDRGEKVVPVSAWHDAHTLKSPDLTKGQKGSDRQALQNKGLVVVHEGKCWINNDLSEKVI